MNVTKPTLSMTAMQMQNALTLLGHLNAIVVMDMLEVELNVKVSIINRVLQVKTWTRRTFSFVP